MKSTPFGIITLTTAVFVVTALASWLGQMHGQETVGDSTVKSGQLDYLSEPPGSTIPQIAEPRSEGQLPARGSQNRAIQETATPAQANPIPESPTLATPAQPSPAMILPGQSIPRGELPPGEIPFSNDPRSLLPPQAIPPPLPTVNSVPGINPPTTIGQPAIPGAPCPHCHSKTCTICCQPKCITKTIWVPQWRTVWNSIFETRHRTEIQEQAHTVEQEVEHQVPEIQQYTVMVPEPRIRTYQEYRQEEYQEAVEEPYSVMVRKPKQRKIPVDREETFRVPVEEEYTVMVPQEKEVAETKYKKVTEKEAKEVKFTVEVERAKKRIVLDYVEQELELRKRVPYTYTKKETLIKKKLVYRNETRTRDVVEHYTDYVARPLPYSWQEPSILHKTRNAQESGVVYVPDEHRETQTVYERSAVTDTIEENYTVAEPYIEKVWETYTESVPYKENVVVSWQSRKQVPRQVTRPYTVRIPYIENIPRQYEIKVPHTVMKKGIRTVPKQIPQTKYQIVKQDKGHWVTEVSTLPTIEVTSDRCGCSTCCPQTKTVRKTRWQPNIVTQRIPYTTYETVKQKVPYEYPVVEYKTGTRTRMEPVTRYREEKRQATLEVFDFKPDKQTTTVEVTKYKQVPKQREISVQRIRQKRLTREIAITKYETTEGQKEIKIGFNVPQFTVKNVEERFDELGPKETRTGEFEALFPVPATRIKTETYVVRVPDTIDVPEEVEVELTEYRDVVNTITVKIPKPRIETTIEKIPEIRTRIEYVDVEKEIPYIVTKKVTEMVPQKRTRTVYKTETRTVAELKTETYFADEEEVFTRTVYKKKVRDVPVNRAEIYWVNVPRVLKKTVFKTVKRKVKRPVLRRVPVKVPYQVEVRIPRQVCTMVPQQITIPVEECCEHCVHHLSGVSDVSNAWADYAWRRTTAIYDWISTSP